GEGNFVLGRIAEELGQREEAVAGYRKAVAAAPAGSPDAARYSVALARVLLPAEKGALLGGPRAGVRLAAGRRGMAVRDLLVLTLVAVQPQAPEEAAQEEALKLADQTLKRPDIDQYPLLKAQALAVQGRWTEALNTYVKGLEPFLSPEQYRE